MRVTWRTARTFVPHLVDYSSRLVASLSSRLADSDICCGSAGLYNIEQPDTADELGRRKAATIRASAAALVATGNIGCLTQLEAHLAGIPVQHTIEVLDSAI